MTDTDASETRGRDAVKTKLINSACEMLAELGPNAMSVRNVASRAGVNHGQVHHYFGGKQGLVEAIFLEGFDSFDDAVLPHYAAGDLLAAGRAYRQWAMANPTHYLIMFGRAVPDFTASDPAMERATRSFEALIEAVANHGAADPAAAAFHLYATVHGYVMLELVDMGPVEADQRDGLYEAGLLAAVAGLN